MSGLTGCGVAFCGVRGEACSTYLCYTAWCAWVDGYDAGIGVEDPCPEERIRYGHWPSGLEEGDIMYQQIKCVFLESIECQWRNGLETRSLRDVRTPSRADEANPSRNRPCSSSFRPGGGLPPGLAATGDPAAGRDMPQGTSRISPSLSSSPPVPCGRCVLDVRLGSFIPRRDEGRSWTNVSRVPTQQQIYFCTESAGEAGTMEMGGRRSGIIRLERFIRHW